MRSIQNAGSWLSALVLACGAYLLVIALHGALRGIGDNVNGDRSYSLVPASHTFFGGVFAERLQRLLGTDNPFLAEASFQTWLSLFWVIPILAFAAFIVGGTRSFYRLLAVHAVVVFTADVLYAVFPTRPPWMDVELVRMISIQAGSVTGVDTNPYASLPSLHVAIPVAYATWFWRQPDPRLRACAPVLTIWAVMMAFVVVYTGEHYAFCVALGALLGIEVNLLLERVHVRGLRPWAHHVRAPAFNEATATIWTSQPNSTP